MDKKIRVGMDISQTAHKGGVVTYTRKLSEELAKNKNLDMVFFYSSFRKPFRKGNLKNVKSYRLPPTFFELLFNRWRNVSIEKFIGPVDVFHSSDWTQPPCKAKKVTTYHDVVPLKYPAWSHPKIVAVHKRRLKLVEKEIDMVIAVSEATKKDLLEVSNIPEDKITVVYEGPSGDFKPLEGERIKKFKDKYNLPEKFILAISGIGERRNLRRIQDASKNYNLVIAGQTLPWLEIDELELLYNSAEALVYCSLYEGFGIPIIDAFASGLPVITSNVSSMREIGGDAAVFADPYSVDSIREKIDVVIFDKDLRNQIIKKGFERSKLFSWKKAAEQTTKVYQKLTNPSVDN